MGVGGVERCMAACPLVSLTLLGRTFVIREKVCVERGRPGRARPRGVAEYVRSRWPLRTPLRRERLWLLFYNVLHHALFSLSCERPPNTFAKEVLGARAMRSWAPRPAWDTFQMVRRIA
eukprot:4252563-Prymnesium_polylepis.1